MVFRTVMSYCSHSFVYLLKKSARVTAVYDRLSTNQPNAMVAFLSYHYLSRSDSIILIGINHFPRYIYM